LCRRNQRDPLKDAKQAKEEKKAWSPGARR
jgi:hypothetical protein